jgi:hypothetical protein
MTENPEPYCSGKPSANCLKCLHDPSGSRIRHVCNRPHAAASPNVAPAQGEVQIKPLTWTEDWSGSNDDIPYWRGDNPLGLRVSFSFAGHLFEGRQIERHDEAPADAVAEAMARETARYEARVRSALAVAPAQGVNDEVVEARGPDDPIPDDYTVMTAAENQLCYLAVEYCSGDNGGPLTAKIAGSMIEHRLREWQQEAHEAQTALASCAAGGGLPKGWDFVSRKAVVDLCRERADELIEMVLNGETEQARLRESMEAAVRRIQYAVAFMEAADGTTVADLPPPPSGAETPAGETSPRAKVAAEALCAEWERYASEKPDEVPDGYYEGHAACAKELRDAIGLPATGQAQWPVAAETPAGDGGE